MPDWRRIKKIDAHVHLLPKEVLDANPDSGDEFSHAKEADLLQLMDRYGIDRAVIMPFNDPFLLSMEFSAGAVHRNLKAICAHYPGRFAAFADIDTRNSPLESALECERALKCPYFKGIKIHAANTGIAIDDPYYHDVLTFAEQGEIPVAFHSYPNFAENDVCAPDRIARVLDRYPDLVAIVCHLGGSRWKNAVKLNAYFDISAFLPDLVLRGGIEECRRILREFPLDRLFFATDWPCSRSCQAEEIYEQYFDILNKMDFTEAEANRIAFGNIARLLWGAER